MNSNETALERAFSLAKSGRFKSVSEIRARLSKEGYQANQIDGPALGRQLRALMRTSSDPDTGKGLDDEAT
ncbi:MAG: hypothetical protein ABI697_03660 [Devosia sp.]